MQMAIKRDIIGLLDMSEEVSLMLQEFSDELKRKIKEQSRQEIYSEHEEDEMLAYIEGKKRERLDMYFNVFLLFLRDIFLYQVLGRDFILKNSDKRRLVHQIAQIWTISDTERRIDLLDTTKYRILSYANQKLAIDAFHLGLLKN